jgi:hypothetical protein
MGIVVSKKPLDYNTINTAINSSTQPDFASKLNEVVADNAISNVSFSSGTHNSIYFKTGTSDSKNIVACIVEIEKE